MRPPLLGSSDCHSLYSILVSGLIVQLSACAHVPKPKDVSPTDLLKSACEPGSKTTSVKGSVWLKAKSQEADGQFPAFVSASAPNQLRLEVTNLIGGTEAVITVRDQEYIVEAPGKKDIKTQKGYRTWGGIPLRFASTLFLGRIPCPADEVLGGSKLSVGPDGHLIIETPATVYGGPERFEYTFHSSSGVLQPATLRWERKGALAQAVDFKFEDPEDYTHSPRKWEAKSSQGEVKVRWKDRETPKG